MTVPLGEPQQGSLHHGDGSFRMCHINMPLCKPHRKEGKVENKRQSFSGVSMTGKKEEHSGKQTRTIALHEDHDIWQ